MLCHPKCGTCVHLILDEFIVLKLDKTDLNFFQRVYRTFTNQLERAATETRY